MQVPFQVPLEVNVVLVGFQGDGGYRYSLDLHKLQEFLKISFPTHRPSCLESGEPLDIEHHLVYNVFPVRTPGIYSSFSIILYTQISQEWEIVQLGSSVWYVHMTPVFVGPESMILADT